MAKEKKKKKKQTKKTNKNKNKSKQNKTNNGGHNTIQKIKYWTRIQLKNADERMYSRRKGSVILLVV